MPQDNRPAPQDAMDGGYASDMRAAKRLHDAVERRLNEGAYRRALLEISQLRIRHPRADDTWLLSLAINRALDVTQAAEPANIGQLAVSMIHTAQQMLELWHAAQARERQMVEALEGLLAEWDRFTQYGSPLAKAANSRVAAARAALASAGEAE